MQESVPAIGDGNLDKAKQILAAAGWRDSNGNGTVDKQGVEAEFTLLYTAKLPHEQGLAMAIAQMLKPIGIKIKPEGSNWGKIKYRTYRDAWLYTLVTRAQDLHALYHSSNGLPNGRPNYSYYSNPIVDRVLERGVRAASEAEASQFWLIINHGLRNIALPAVTLQFANLSELFGGSILAEKVFGYPGLGDATVQGTLRGDVPLLVGIVFFSAVFVFAGNAIADLTYQIIDPRIRLGNPTS